MTAEVLTQELHQFHCGECAVSSDLTDRKALAETQALEHDTTFHTPEIPEGEDG